MNFLSQFMIKWALITPWFLYIIGILFGISCLWQKGRSDRKVISIAIFFFATVIMVVLVWLDNYRAMSELIKATYYFPELH